MSYKKVETKENGIEKKDIKRLPKKRAEKMSRKKPSK